MLLWNTAIPYWLFATGRYFIVMAKVQNVYESYYGGFGKPTTDDPLEYPYPFYSGGSHYSRNTRFSSDSADHRSFWDPGLSSSQGFVELLLSLSFPQLINVKIGLGNQHEIVIQKSQRIFQKKQISNLKEGKIHFALNYHT